MILEQFKFVLDYKKDVYGKLYFEISWLHNTG